LKRRNGIDFSVYLVGGQILPQMAAAKAPALTSDAILHHNAWGEDVAQTDHLSGNAILRGLHTSMAWRLIFDGLAWLTHGKMTLVIGQNG